MDYTVEITLTAQMTRTVISTGQGRPTESRQATTPDNVTGILACLESGASQLGYAVRDLLKQTKVVTLSAPEFVSEALAAGAGARIGLIVSQGYEATAYGHDSTPNPLVGSIVSRALSVGIAEETNEQGRQIRSPKIEEVKDRLKHLLELGSGILVVSFKNAPLNPANERRLQEIMRRDYPRHYLGAVPLLLASDFSREFDTLLNWLQIEPATPAEAEGLKLPRWPANPEGCTDLTMSSTPWILDFENISRQLAAEVGNKCANLGEMRRISASWTAAFSMINGLITDGGGALSHPVIMAREYGIPCVAGCVEGTQKIQTGQTVKVDGDLGVVYILN